MDRPTVRSTARRRRISTRTSCIRTAVSSSSRRAPRTKTLVLANGKGPEQSGPFFELLRSGQSNRRVVLPDLDRGALGRAGVALDPSKAKMSEGGSRRASAGPFPPALEIRSPPEGGPHEGRDREL